MPGFSVKKPLTVYVVVLAILVLGVVAYLKMTPDLMPNMDYPYVILVTSDPGASPESVEKEITKPLEKSMATLDQLKSITSSSQNSVSMVVLEFEDDANMDSLGIDIQQKISSLQGDWDDTVSTPYMLKLNPSMIPVMVGAISSSEMDVGELSDFVEEELADKLTGITGVASVEITGTMDRQMNVVLDAEKLAALTEIIRQKAGDALNKVSGQLSSAKQQVLDAQKALDDGIAQAADGIGDGITDALDQAVDALRDAMNASPELSPEEQALRQAIADAEAEMTANNDRIAANNEILNSEEATEEEKAAALAENETLTQANLALAQDIARDMKTLSQLVEERTRQQLRDGLDEMERVIGEMEDYINDPNRNDGLQEQISSGVESVMDGVLLMTEGNVQLKLALQQIEEGEQQLAATRKQVLEQLDLNGMLSVTMIQQLLTAQDFSMPAGYIDDQDGVSYMVSVGNEISTSDELADMVLFDLGIDGLEPIRLSDVATVFYTDNSDEIYAKLNGENGIIVSFNKQSNYATAEVSDNITARMETLTAQYEGLSFKPLMDQGDYIHLIVETILSSLLWGALFSVVVLFLFLRDWRPTLITLISIPTSVIFAVVLMYFTGVTINMISLSGLAVSVGMLVDNSVVVIENIYRLRARGATVVQAAVSGAQQVLGAITASTLTTVCVFAPIVFVEGLTRELFTDLALTMTYSLLASLIVALTLVPAMASGMLRKEKSQKPGLLDRVYPAYRKAVSWSIHHKLVVLGVSLLLLVGSAGATLARGFAFMPNIDMNTVNLTVSMPEGCTREQAVSLADEVLRRAAQVENVETVGAMMSSSGSSGGMDMTSMMSSGGGAYDVTAYITLTEGASGAKTGQQIEAACTGMDCTVTASGAMDSYMTYLTGSGVTLNVYGSDMEQMQSAAKTLAAKLATVPGTENVSDGLEQAATALHLSVDRNAAMEKGLTVAQVYMAVASALTDTDSSLSLTLDGLDVSVSIQSPEESRMTREKLMDLEIDPSAMSAMSSMMSAASGSGSMSGMSGMSSGSGSMSGMSGMSGMSSGSTSAVQAAEPVRLGDIAKLEETVSLNTIHRDQQRRYITVSADVADGYNVTKVTTAAQTAIAEVDLPQGITASFQGENEAIMDAIRQLLLMLLLGIVLVYLVMVAQFQSLRSPLIVMFTIPLAFTGGFLALLLAGIEVSVVSLVGFVMLVGVIVNNGIVLVDYINQLRLEGMGRREAIIEAGVTRLRPILMTSLTTILGLVVMAFGKNVGTALMQPVALVCIGGLLYATLMTLLVVPCMYDILSRRDLRKVNEEELQLLDL